MKEDRKLIVSIALNLALSVLACVLFYRWEQSRQSLRQAGLNAEYERLVARLYIPAEALYFNGKAFIEICDLRKSYFPQTFLPYQAVVRPGSETLCTSETPGNIWNGSFEHYWINEVNRGLAELGSRIENGGELSVYIQDHAAGKTADVVPLLERLLASVNSHHRIRAARALLALGHRDSQVIDVVKAFEEEERIPAISDGGTKMVYSWERDTAVKLDTQYGLGIRDQSATLDAGDSK